MEVRGNDRRENEIIMNSNRREEVGVKSNRKKGERTKNMI